MGPTTNTLFDLHQTEGANKKMETHKTSSLREQIADISEEQSTREKRKHKQKEENKSNKKGKVKTADTILKINLKTHKRTQKSKQEFPPDKRLKGEIRYKYKDKQDGEAN